MKILYSGRREQTEEEKKAERERIMQEVKYSILEISKKKLNLVMPGEEEGDAEVDGQEEEVGARPGVEEAEEEE